jgi:lipopolysaccharide transport system ATP-binding protein
MAGIIFQDVTKSFPRKPGQKWLKSFVTEVAQREKVRFQALTEVSFSILDGQSVALIGRNGAGKSTVLNLIAGLLTASRGSVEVQGRTAALLDLGAGFHPDLTGRENLVINSALLGLTRQEVRDRTEGIIEFSGLGEFIDQPIRTYSAGMTMRLAFSVSVSVDPDILLIDEVLAVGDAAFQSRCTERILELKKSGKIFVCVSHSLALDQLCDTAIWLEQGRVKQSGPIDSVLTAYKESFTTNVEIRQEETREPKVSDAGEARRQRRSRRS